MARVAGEVNNSTQLAISEQVTRLPVRQLGAERSKVITSTLNPEMPDDQSAYMTHSCCIFSWSIYSSTGHLDILILRVIKASDRSSYSPLLHLMVASKAVTVGKIDDNAHSISHKALNVSGFFLE